MVLACRFDFIWHAFTECLFCLAQLSHEQSYFSVPSRKGRVFYFCIVRAFFRYRPSGGAGVALDEVRLQRNIFMGYNDYNDY